MFINNVAPKQCRCFSIESITEINTKRKYTLTENNLKDDASVEKFIQETHAITYYDIRLGNICNLQCLMCAPVSSNQLYNQETYKNSIDRNPNKNPNESKIILDSLKNETKNIKDYYEKLYTFDWANDDFFHKLEQQITKQLSNKVELITFYFIGGEPLLNKPHFKFLRRLVELGLSKYIQLEYNTNLTIVTDDILKLWNNFAHLTLAISIDDIQERYEYIRYPAIWNKIYNNVKEISHYINNKSNISYNIVPVRNILTCDGYSQLKSYFESEFNLSKIYPLMSDSPSHTVPSILTYDEKMLYLDALPQDKNFEDIKKYILKFEYSDTSRSMFFKMLPYWEHTRNTKFKDTFTLLSAILKII